MLLGSGPPCEELTELGYLVPGHRSPLGGVEALADAVREGSHGEVALHATHSTREALDISPLGTGADSRELADPARNKLAGTAHGENPRAAAAAIIIVVVSTAATLVLRPCHAPATPVVLTPSTKSRAYVRIEPPRDERPVLSPRPSAWRSALPARST